MVKGPRIGNGRLDAVMGIGPLTLADNTEPCLAIQWAGQPVRGEKQTVQRHEATATIDADGATGSKLLLTLTVKRRDFDGDDLADLTYAISGAAAKVAWTSTSASGTASASTFQEVADLISELPGFKAWVLNAPRTASVNSGHFIDLAATGIGSGTSVSGYSTILYRDVSEYTEANGDKVFWHRIGLPEARDRNSFNLLRVNGKVTGATNGVVSVYRDDADGQEVYLSDTMGDTTVQTDYIDRDKNDADTVRGPIIIEARSDDATAATFYAAIMQAQIGA